MIFFIFTVEILGHIEKYQNSQLKDFLDVPTKNMNFSEWILILNENIFTILLLLVYGWCRLKISIFII